MNLDVIYEVQEVTYYTVLRRYNQTSVAGSAAGWDMSGKKGLFEFREDAEVVRDALEADVARKVRQAL